MPPKRKRCIVPKCTSHLEMENKVSLHRFPKDINLKEKWIQEISTSDWTPNPKESSRICSNHFHYKTKIGNKIFITSNAIRKNTTDTIIEEDTAMFELQELGINNEGINIEDDTAVFELQEMEITKELVISTSSLADMDQPLTSKFHIEKQNEVKKRNKLSPKKLPQKVLLSSSVGSSARTNLINNNAKRVQKQIQNENMKKLRKLYIKYREKNKYLEQKLLRKNKKIAFLKSIVNKLQENKLKNCKVVISPISKGIIRRKSKKKL